MEPPKPPNRNMIFLGPPGTGKSTVATNLGKVLHQLKVLQTPTVVVIDKDNPLPPGKNIEERFRLAYDKAKGGIIFFDEVHKLCNPKDASGKQHVPPLLALSLQRCSTVMTIIAGYTDEVNEWLPASDPGMSSRFPRPNRIEFARLPVDQLFAIGVDRLKEQGFTLEEQARDAMRACMHVVHSADPPENARGARGYVDAMVQIHDASDHQDDCITTHDIYEACPEAHYVDLSAMAVAAPSAPASEPEPPSTDPPASVGGPDEREDDPELPRCERFVDKMVNEALRKMRAHASPAASNAVDTADSSRKRQADEAAEGAAAKRPAQSSSAAADAHSEPPRQRSLRKRPSTSSAVANSHAAAGAPDGSDSDEPLSSRQRKNAAAGSSSSAAVGAPQPPQPTVAPAPPPVAPPQPPAAQPSPLQRALRVLYPSAEAALGKFRLDIVKALDDSDNAEVRQGWKSLGDREVREQVLNPVRGNKKAHQILDDAFQEMYGLVFEPLPPAGHGKQGGNRLVRSMPAADA